MKKNSFFIIVLLFVIFLNALFIFPQKASAITLNLDYPSFNGIDLNNNQGLDDAVAWTYYGIITISGIAAFVMIVWGGVQWIISAGSPVGKQEAKDRIKNALLGLLLVLASFIIIQIINPDLTVLSGP